MKRAAMIMAFSLQFSATFGYAMDECGGFVVDAKDNKFYWATKVCNQKGEIGPLIWSAEETALNECHGNSSNPEACHFLDEGECVAGPRQNGGFASLVAYRGNHFVGCGRSETAAEKAARRMCNSKYPGAKCAVRMTLEY